MHISLKWCPLALAMLCAPVSLRAQCATCQADDIFDFDTYHCGFTPNNGYYECASSPGNYCAGVLPRCYNGGNGPDRFGISPDGSLNVRFADAGQAPGSDGGTPEDGVVRRPCDGAVVARRYSSERAAELYRNSAVISI